MAGADRGHRMPAGRVVFSCVLAACLALLAACGTTGGGDREGQATPEAERIDSARPAPAAAPAPTGPGGRDLVLAARFGQERTLRHLLREVDVDARDGLGRTALIAAAGESRPSVLELLIGEGADPALRDRDGNDALTVAAVRGQTGNLQPLLDAGADIGARAPNGETPLMAAIRAGQIGAVEALLARGADPNVYDQDEISARGRQTPLMYAARYGFGESGLRVMRRLLESGAIPNVRRPNGETALTLAQHRNQTRMVQELRAWGARDESAYAGLTPGEALIAAIRLDDFDKAREILAAEEVGGYRDPQTGVTPLAAAAWYGRLAVAELLIERGADVDDVPWGLREERIAVWSVPVARRGLLSTVARGDTALISAVRRAHPGLAERLLAAGANPMIPNRDGETAALLAVRAGQARTVEALLAAGYDPDAVDYPRTASYLLTRRARGESMPPLLVEAARGGHVEVVGVLLAAGAAPDIRDPAGRTPLHDAAGGGHTSIVTLLLEAGATADVRDEAGTSVLMCASRRGHADIAALLLERGVGMNHIDRPGGDDAEGPRGMSALLYAIDGGHTDVVKLLLGRGAQTTLRTGQGETALDLARRLGNEEAVALLAGRTR